MTETEITREKPYAFFNDKNEIVFAFKIPKDRRWISFYYDVKVCNLVERESKGDPLSYLRMNLNTNLMDGKNLDDRKLQQEHYELYCELQRQAMKMFSSLGIKRNFFEV